MNRENIIRMAREAGVKSPDLYKLTVSHMPIETLERFAALVAAAEREACTRVAELVAREIDDTNGTATYIAAAIRARGQA